MLDNFFKLKENNTDIKTELLAGVTTFFTMAYIIFVNPEILAAAGMDRGAVFVATCLASALGTALMGSISNYPIALAPGMGVNAFFSYSVVVGMGHSWQVALGTVFIAGILFLAISVLPIREWIFNAIPKSQKIAISVGIGFFLAIIALNNTGVIVASPETLVKMGNMHDPKVLLAIACFFTICALSYYQIPGSILIGMLLISLLGLLVGHNQFNGIFSAPPDISPIFLEMDLAGAFDVTLVGIILAFLFVHMFDTAGTLISVAWNAKLLDEKDQLPKLNKVLLADSTSMMAGAAIGTSPVTSYIESVSGVKAGGKTGLTSLTVSALFIASIMLSPLASAIPPYATGPALLFVATMMIKDIVELDWEDITEYVPAIMVMFIMPMSFSITDGIAFGFISYAVLKLLCGKFHQLNAGILFVALLFLAKFVFLEV